MEKDEVIGYAILDNHKDNDLDAILSMGRTVFVSLILSCAAMMFTNDIEKLILNPIEKML